MFLFPQAEDSDDAVAEEPSEDFVLQDSSEEEPDIGVVLASVRFTPVSRPFHAPVLRFVSVRPAWPLQEQLAGTGTPPKPAAKGAKKANATGGSEDFQMIGKGEKTRTENCPLSSRAGNKKEDVFAKTGLGHAPTNGGSANEGVSCRRLVGRGERGSAAILDPPVFVYVLRPGRVSRRGNASPRPAWPSWLRNGQ
eukprot:COSAG06_NODE_669_length_13222_cov_8.235922_15_plen_195_part_00